MNIRRKIFQLICLCAAIMGTITQVPGQGAGVARITRLQHPVEIVHHEGKSDTPVQKGMFLTQGDILKTGNEGRCCFIFAGGSEVILNQRSTMLIKSGELLVLTSGDLWAHIRGERMISFDTAAGEIRTGSLDTELVISVDREEQKTRISVLSGKVELVGGGGNIPLASHQAALLSAGSIPRKMGDLKESDMEEFDRQANFQNKTALLIINEILLDEHQESGALRQEVEKILTGNRYTLLGEENLKEPESQKNEGDKKTADRDAFSLVRENLKKPGIDCIVSGKVMTHMLGNVGSGLVSCGSRGELRIYVGPSGELLSSRISNSTSIGKNPQKTAREAAGKATRELAGYLSGILWDINQSLADCIPLPPQESQIEITVMNCSAAERKTIMERLKKRPDIHSITAGAPQKDRVILLVETTASAGSLAEFLGRMRQPDLQIMEAGREKIKLRIKKKNTKN